LAGRAQRSQAGARGETLGGERETEVAEEHVAAFLSW
jgi:hypothetical protein